MGAEARVNAANKANEELWAAWPSQYSWTVDEAAEFDPSWPAPVMVFGGTYEQGRRWIAKYAQGKAVPVSGVPLGVHGGTWVMVGDAYRHPDLHNLLQYAKKSRLKIVTRIG